MFTRFCPWMYATPTLAYYDRNFFILTNVQFVVVMAGFAAFWWENAWGVADCMRAFIRGIDAVHGRIAVDEPGGDARNVLHRKLV